MGEHDQREAIAFYEQLLENESDDRRAVGWRTSYVQDVNFLTLARVEGLGSGARVVDVGCGLGALKGFFDRIGMEVEYTGYDLSARMVEGAQRRHPGVRFEVRDILRDPPAERFDFVFCSGTLNRRTPDHQRLVTDMLRAMYQLADVALAFNLLSAWAYLESPGLQRNRPTMVYAWPEEMFRFCKHLSPYVTLSHDSHHGHFAVFVYRRNRAALERYLAYTRPGPSYGPDVEAAIDYHLDLGLFAELRELLGRTAPRAEVWHHLGQAQAALGETDLARASFAKAIAADPTIAGPHLGLGHLAKKSGDLDQAIACCRRAVAAEPALLAAREALIQTLLAAGQHQQAETAVADMPVGPLRDYLTAVVALAVPVSEQTRAVQERALAALDQALAAAPQYLDALVLAAMLRERQGDPGRALLLWRRAQRIAPMDSRIADRIAICQGH